MPCGFLIKMCVYDKLSCDSVPTQLSLSSSPLLGSDAIPHSLPMYPCLSPSHLSPLGDKKALLLLVTPSQQMHNRIHLCMPAEMNAAVYYAEFCITAI